MEEAWYIFATYIFFDCIQVVLLGTIQGLGMIAAVRWTTATSYWLFGIPLSLLMVI